MARPKGSKTAKTERIIYSCRMKPELVRWLDQQAAYEDRFVYEIIEEAVGDYLKKTKQARRG